MEIQRRLSHTNIVQFRGACCEYLGGAEAEASGGSGGSFNNGGPLANADSSGGGGSFTVSC